VPGSGSPQLEIASSAATANWPMSKRRKVISPPKTLPPRGAISPRIYGALSRQGWPQRQIWHFPIIDKTDFRTT
jgi:hypothetical protein